MFVINLLSRWPLECLFLCSSCCTKTWCFLLIVQKLTAKHTCPSIMLKHLHSSFLQYQSTTAGCCGPSGPLRSLQSLTRSSIFQCKSCLSCSLVHFKTHIYVHRPTGQGTAYIPPHVTEALLANLKQQANDSVIILETILKNLKDQKMMMPTLETFVRWVLCLWSVWSYLLMISIMKNGGL